MAYRWPYKTDNSEMESNTYEQLIYKKWSGDFMKKG